MKVTKSAIDRLIYSKQDGKQDIYWDDQLPGFGVRVYPSGKKSFVLFYRAKGRQHIRVIGQYGTITLEQARDRAKKDLVAVLDERDPLEEKQKARRGSKFKQLCDDYIERHAKEHKKSWVEDKRRIDKYLLPAFSTTRIDAITRADVAQLHVAISKNYPYMANRCLEQLSKMFQLAALWGHVPAGHMNPAKGIQANKEEKRDRWIKPDELPRLAKAINNEENLYGSKALWLYLLLGVRRDELLRAKWSDIDWERKELRLSETKADRIHYVPLSGPAITILQDLPKQRANPYILPGEKRGHHLVNIEKVWQRVRKAAGVEDVRLHDLRRTLGSWLAQSGNSLHLIGRVLNHSSQSTTAIYARFAQDNVREALEKHGEKLMNIAKKDAPVKQPLKGKPKKRSSRR
jgi:integrase